ncbi:MAG: sterol desaturase family protein [Nannocystaceae bacterium]|nr:sterol desaturase family protein [Nannocystaceae bacterium]
MGNELPRWIDAALPMVLAATGLLHPESPATYYACLGVAFACLATVVLGGAAVMYAIAGRVGTRIQGPRERPPKLGAEAFESGRAMFVAACLAAWPMAQWQLGHPTGMVWDLGDHAWWAVVLQTVAGVLVIDGWLYLKHRLLHTRWLFGFHRAHHAFRDPTPFAGFAVAPVEALLTFWPILILCAPAATHWAPLYFGLVLGFIGLNFYLHCGVTWRWIEATLPRVLLNTSAFHNVHHSHVKVNFGEAMVLWDRICRTRAVDADTEPLEAAR